MRKAPAIADDVIHTRVDRWDTPEAIYDNEWRIAETRNFWAKLKSGGASNVNAIDFRLDGSEVNGKVVGYTPDGNGLTVYVEEKGTYMTLGDKELATAFGHSKGNWVDQPFYVNRIEIPPRSGHWVAVDLRDASKISKAAADPALPLTWEDQGFKYGQGRMNGATASSGTPD